MTICIGHMGGRGWRAELDFNSSEAVIVQPSAKGSHTIGPVATVPLGVVIDGDDDHDPQLDPADEQNRNLMSLVFAPDAWECLRNLHRDIKARLDKIGYHKPAKNLTDAEEEWADAESDMLDEIEKVLECLNVPE